MATAADLALKQVLTLDSADAGAATASTVASTAPPTAALTTGGGASLVPKPGNDNGLAALNLPGLKLDQPPSTSSAPPTAPSTPLVPGTGVTTAYVDRQIDAEGLAKNPMSSAEGTGGFVDGTWLAITRGEPEVAGKTQQQILQMRVTDPQFARRMVGKLAVQNAQFLQSIGAPVNDGTLYLAAFMGPMGAQAVMAAPPDTPIEQVKGPKGEPIGAIALSKNPQLAGMTAGSLIDFTAATIAGKRPGQAADDPAFIQYQAANRAAIDDISRKVDGLMAQAQAEAPDSAERHRLLQLAIDHSQQLEQRYEKLSQKPPQLQSPFEAAGTFTPLLIGLVTLAGGLTRRPALGAINALGSALGALKQGNDENYKNAIDLWDKQTDLASKAFSIQNQTIDSIVKDMELNERERQEKLENAFRILGLDKDLQLAKANQWKDVYEHHDNRLKLQSTLDEAAARAKKDLAAAAKDRVIAESGGVPGIVGAEYGNLIRAWGQAHPNEDGTPGTPDDTTKGQLLEEAHKRVGGTASTKQPTPEQGYYAALRKRQEDANEAAGRPRELTPDQEADIAKKAQEQKYSLTHNVNVTGNERVKLIFEMRSYDEALNNLQDAFQFMADNSMIAGIGGKVMRGTETAEDILGSDSTEYNDFKRRIEELQLRAKQLLNQTDAARGAGGANRYEHDLITDVIPGLSSGQPTAQVYSQMLHLQQIFADMMEDRRQILAGNLAPPIAPAGTPEARDRPTTATTAPPAASAPPPAATSPAPAATGGDWWKSY